MEIRILTEEDAALYRALRLEALQTNPEAFGSSYEDEEARPLSATAERLRAQQTPGTFTLGALENGALIGTVTVVRDQGRKMRHRANVYAMYVTPAARGRGVGRALLAEAIRRARAVPGLEQLHLAVVSSNTTARALYDALGFVVYGRDPRTLKIGEQYFDEDMMVLRL
jgi:ribosomal protein S18 acetylase RimI-like enzyme